jgi:amidase
VEGHVTGAGNPDWKKTHEPATKTARAITALLEAGSKLVGKSLTDELAFGLDGINPHYGTPVNAQYNDRIPGGSSSGSVSAVSCGMVDFALGTDTGGSVRVPASYCGIYGIRPSFGRISVEGVTPLAPSCDTVGWFARSPQILKKVGQVLLKEQTSSRRISEILVARDLFEVVSDSIKPALENAIKRLTLLGYSLVDTTLAPLNWQDCLKIFRVIQGREAWKCHGEWIESVEPNFSSFIKERFDYSKTVTQEQYQDALSARQQIVGEFEKLLDENRVLCLPISRDLPPLMGASPEELVYNRKETLKLSTIASLTGQPQVTIPVELTRTTKVGLSFIAPRGRDMLLLDLCEKVTSPIN